MSGALENCQEIDIENIITDHENFGGFWVNVSNKFYF